MKRSEINAIMKKALKLFKDYKISLPPFVTWSPEEWKSKGDEVAEIVLAMNLWTEQGEASKRCKDICREVMNDYTMALT